MKRKDQERCKLKRDLPKGQPILTIDFDGVLHSYNSGWCGINKIPDEPVKGAIVWMKSLLKTGDNEELSQKDKTFKIAIYSSRSKSIFGIIAMKKWLMKQGLSRHQLELISFPIFKPASYLQIDDRCFCFKGRFPTEKELHEFKPWRSKCIGDK